jgi:rSAM/selenodomain-associated transferase 1
MTRRLVVFARLPRLGRVKTRLAATVGDERALAVHRRLLETTVALAESFGADRLELCYDGEPSPTGDWPLTLASSGWDVVPQQGADLGARMWKALRGALSRGEQVLLVGSDCPVLRPDDLHAAFEALGRTDAVFAPTEDGGYALVGLRRALPTLFSEMPWSTARVMDETRARLAAAGASATELRTVWDVDVEADMKRWEAGR